ncbi:hypothetical protein V8F33_001440 [Rhypophila sp. PSN 637]
MKANAFIGLLILLALTATALPIGNEVDVTISPALLNEPRSIKVLAHDKSVHRRGEDGEDGARGVNSYGGAGGGSGDGSGGRGVAFRRTASDSNGGAGGGSGSGMPISLLVSLISSVIVLVVAVAVIVETFRTKQI